MTVIEVEPTYAAGKRLGVDTTSTSMAAYFRMFSPGPAWSDLLDWPPDVFAFTNIVLSHTEAYRFAVTPPLGLRWPPQPGWSEQVATAASQWRKAAAVPLGGAPPAVQQVWHVIERHLRMPLEEVRRGTDHEFWEALLLHRMPRGQRTVGVPKRGLACPTRALMVPAAATRRGGRQSTSTRRSSTGRASRQAAESISDLVAVQVR
jgi:hypothetical protein